MDWVLEWSVTVRLQAVLLYQVSAGYLSVNLNLCLVTVITWVSLSTLWEAVWRNSNHSVSIVLQNWLSVKNSLWIFLTGTSSSVESSISRDDQRDTARLALFRNSQSFKKAARGVVAHERAGTSTLSDLETWTSLKSWKAPTLGNEPIHRSTSLDIDGKSMKDVFSSSQVPKLVSRHSVPAAMNLATINLPMESKLGIQRTGSYSGLEFLRTDSMNSGEKALFTGSKPIRSNSEHWVRIELDSAPESLGVGPSKTKTVLQLGLDESPIINRGINSGNFERWSFLNLQNTQSLQSIIWAGTSTLIPFTIIVLILFPSPNFDWCRPALTQLQDLFVGCHQLQLPKVTRLCHKVLILRTENSKVPLCRETQSSWSISNTLPSVCQQWWEFHKLLRDHVEFFLHFDTRLTFEKCCFKVVFHKRLLLATCNLPTASFHFSESDSFKVLYKHWIVQHCPFCFPFYFLVLSVWKFMCVKGRKIERLRIDLFFHGICKSIEIPRIWRMFSISSRMWRRGQQLSSSLWHCFADMWWGPVYGLFLQVTI